MRATIAEGSTMLRNFFTSIDLSLRNNGLLHNDVGQRIKLNELDRKSVV